MKKLPLALLLILSVITITSFNSCKDEEGNPTINIFTVDDDIAFGQQFQQELAANPQEYPILNPGEYPQAYQHLNRIRDSILNTGEVAYDDVFAWEVYIIHNDETLNAFAVPGGYMYFYTGLIKYLDNEAQFAGVLAHETAHVAKRHSTNQLTKAYGLSILLSIILGDNPGMIAEIAAGLAQGLTTLAFSRDHEYQADEYAVKYLYKTSYDARGIAGFFEKLEGAPGIPEFLSTHPSPENRIEEIYAEWENLGGKIGNTYKESYQQFKNSLP